MKHIFPDVPINSGCFAPLHIAQPAGTFLVAEYPRPVAGCASEVAQRIMEAVFGAMGQAIPERIFAAPAGTSGNFGSAATTPTRTATTSCISSPAAVTAAGGRPTG